MEQTLRANGFLKETVAAIITIHENTNAMVRSIDRGTNFFVIIAGVLEGDSLAPYLLIICQDNIFRPWIDCMKQNGSTQRKPETITAPNYVETITATNYVDDLALHMNAIA